MNKDELHVKLDALVPGTTTARRSIRMIGHALIELERVTSMTCNWDGCAEETREFASFLSLGRGKRHPRSPSIDHVISRSDGGSDLPSNLQLLHFVCNVRKGSIDARKNPAVQQKHAEALSKRWKDPAYREMMANLPRSKIKSPEERERRSRRLKMEWADPERRAKRLEAVRRGHATRKARKAQEETE